MAGFGEWGGGLGFLGFEEERALRDLGKKLGLLGFNARAP
jgi:hypothetical protein